MFLTVLTFLRLCGKKGVRQLSFFEVAIIISLGTAAGDPMLTDNGAILPGLMVFLVVLDVDRLITWLITRSERVEMLMEGRPEYVVEGGMFVLGSHEKHTFAQDEFFSEMRQQSVEHLGQVNKAILETNGILSLFFYSKEDTKPGLPISPKEYEQASERIDEPGDYACTYCGQVEDFDKPKECNRCQKKKWVKALDSQRES